MLSLLLSLNYVFIKLKTNFDFISRLFGSFATTLL